MPSSCKRDPRPRVHRTLVAQTDAQRATYRCRPQLRHRIANACPTQRIPIRAADAPGQGSRKFHSATMVWTSGAVITTHTSSAPVRATCGGFAGARAMLCDGLAHVGGSRWLTRVRRFAVGAACWPCPRASGLPRRAQDPCTALRVWSERVFIRGAQWVVMSSLAPLVRLRSIVASTLCVTTARSRRCGTQSHARHGNLWRRMLWGTAEASPHGGATAARSGSQEVGQRRRAPALFVQQGAVEAPRQPMVATASVPVVGFPFEHC